MGIQPTDLGQDFVKKGMRLITQTSSDALMKKRLLVIIRKNLKILKKKYKYMRSKYVVRCHHSENHDILRISP